MASATDLPTAPSLDTPDRADLRSGWVETVGSLGFAAKGVLYLVIGLVAASVIAGSGQTDQAGAIRRVAQLPFGTVLLVALAIGLGGYALLRLVHVFANPSGEDGAKGAGMRASYLFRAVVYGGLCASAVAVLLGDSSGGGQRGQELTARALELPLGTWLVATAAAVAVGVGLYQAYKGITRTFEGQINTAGGGLREGIVGCGVVGHLARGVVFTSLGVLLANAAMTQDPSEAGGIDAAIGQLSSTGYGAILLPLVGLGLAAYGLFCFGMAAYGTARTAE